MTSPMNFLTKTLDPAGRFVASRAFKHHHGAVKQAIKWSYYGATSYVMNGSIRAIYRGGIRLKISQQ